jgi:hypothetical protein
LERACSDAHRQEADLPAHCLLTGTRRASIPDVDCDTTCPGRCNNT